MHTHTQGGGGGGEREKDSMFVNYSKRGNVYDKQCYQGIMVSYKVRSLKRIQKLHTCNTVT